MQSNGSSVDITANNVGNPRLPEPGVVVSEDTGVAAAASGAEVGDLFEYRIEQPVTLERNRSALIPIIQTRLEGAHVSVYNAAFRQDRPMGALRLRNSSNLTFEAGPLTIFDGDSYAGEATLARFKPGEERFIPFAVDFSTLVTTKSEKSTGPVYLLKSTGGVLTAEYYDVNALTYTLKNQTDRKRVVYIEHPNRPGYELSDTSDKPVETTAKYRRFRVELGPRETKTVAVSERTAATTEWMLSDLTRDEVALLVRRGYLDGDARAKLEAIADAHMRISAIEAELERSEEEAEKITEDQERLRDNIAALKDTASARELVARYIVKASEQESRLDAIEAERRAKTAEKERLEAEVRRMIREFSIDRRVGS